jgi:hypothetical protein
VATLLVKNELMNPTGPERRTIADRIAAKRQDEAFCARVRNIIEQNQQVLERLAE